MSRGDVLLIIILRICTVNKHHFWALCIAWYSEEKVPVSVLKWKLEESNVKTLDWIWGWKHLCMWNTVLCSEYQKCIKAINIIILILIYRYNNALELIKLPTFRLTSLQSSHECRHHHWHWQYVYVTFRILYLACLKFHIASCYTHLVCLYV